MQLVGFSYGPPSGKIVPGPLRRGYLALDQLTAVVGPNDSGKSHLLARIARALEGPGEGIVFAACSTEEFSGLTGHAISDLIPYQEPAYPRELCPAEGERPSWWDGPSWSAARLDASRLGEIKLNGTEDPIDAWKAALVRVAEERRDEWGVVLEAATASTRAHLDSGASHRAELPAPLIALERADVTKQPDVPDEELDALVKQIYPEGRPKSSAKGWNLYWCLPPFDRLPPPVQEALRGCGLEPAAHDPDLWEKRSERSGLPEPPEHRRLRQAPLLVAPLGRTDLPIAPSPLRLPLGWDEVGGEIEAAIGRLVSSTRWADRLLTDELDSGTWLMNDVGWGENFDSADPLPPTEAWRLHDNRTGVWHVHPDAQDAADLIESRARSRLPRFISQRYDLRLYLYAPDHWESEGKIHLVLRPLGEPANSRIEEGDDDGRYLDFPIEDAAEGHHLWLQFALLEAADAVQRVAVPLGEWANDVANAGQEFLVAEENADDTPQLEQAVDSGRDRLREVLAEFRDSEPHEPGAAQGRASDLRVLPYGRATHSTATMVELLRSPLYVIDEPERHLHPRLQREAASWLADTVRQHGTQAVIATHSVPFMGLSAGARYTYLTREEAGAALLNPITPRDLTHLDGAADELGLNRGELMTLITVFLWVEGPMDKAVLEGLFPEELHNYGIAVAPMSGHSRALALLDAALLRFTEAKVAVWLDNIPGEFLASLRNDLDFAQQAAAEEKDERQTLARLVLAARQQEKEIHPVGGEQPASDVFDLLDDGVIQDLFPGYPGHAEAHARWEEAMASEWKKGQRKNFWGKEFKTPIDVESCTLIAERMREQGRQPPGLAAVIEACERLAAELN